MSDTTMTFISKGKEDLLLKKKKVKDFSFVFFFFLNFILNSMPYYAF